MHLRLLSIDASDAISDLNVSMIDLPMLASNPGSIAALELDDDITELLLLEDDAAMLDDEDDFLITGAGLTTFGGVLWIMRASVVQRPGTMPSSSEVQCIMPVQSLGE